MTDTDNPKSVFRVVYSITDGSEVRITVVASTEKKAIALAKKCFPAGRRQDLNVENLSVPEGEDRVLDVQFHYDESL